MKSELYIKYEGSISQDDSCVVLSDLGQSLIAFEELIKHLGHTFKLETDIGVYITSRRQGSQIIDVLVQIRETIDSLPFDSVEHLLEFLKLASHDLWQQATAFFDELKEVHRTVNDFGKEYPVNIALFVLLIPSIIKWVRGQRHKPSPVDNRISERLAKELFKLIQKNRFGNFIYPIVNESAKSIEVSTDRDFRKNTARVDTNNFEDYMGEETEILPHLEDSVECQLRGEITSLKSTRGDSLTFHFQDKGKVYNLDLFPREGKTTKHYVQFYKENVEVRAIVERTSVYKKPKLHILDLSLVQPELDL